MWLVWQNKLCKAIAHIQFHIQLADSFSVQSARSGSGLECEVQPLPDTGSGPESWGELRATPQMLLPISVKCVKWTTTKINLHRRPKAAVSRATIVKYSQGAPNLEVLFVYRCLIKMSHPASPNQLPYLKGLVFLCWILVNWKPWPFYATKSSI